MSYFKVKNLSNSISAVAPSSSVISWESTYQISCSSAVSRQIGTTRYFVQSKIFKYSLLWI